MMQSVSDLIFAKLDILMIRLADAAPAARTTIQRQIDRQTEQLAAALEREEREASKQLAY